MAQQIEHSTVMKFISFDERMQSLLPRLEKRNAQARESALAGSGGRR